MLHRRSALLLLLALPAAAAGPGAGPVNLEAGPAVGGYDPVAYFAEGKAVRGRAEFALAHDGATYRFASAATRDAFRADPDRYLPQYGGYCAFGMARGYKAVIDPTAFTIADGRLYLNYNHAIQAEWRGDRDRQIRRADANWPLVQHSPSVSR